MTIEQVTNEDVRFPGAGGEPVAGRWFLPDGDPAGVVAVAPAMAMPMRFYRHIAAWLADRGLAVLTFSYRGSEPELYGPLRESPATALDWYHDAEGAAVHARARADAAGVPLTWVGHSFGGQSLGFLADVAVDRCVMVASGTGWRGLAAPPIRTWSPLLWRVVAPAAIAVTGYYPGRRLRILDDLPAGVMRQWGRWCLHRDYLFSEHPELRERFAKVATPVTALWTADDELISPESIRYWSAEFPGTEIELVEMRAADHGLTRIGHSGFFRPQRAVLWEELLLPRLAVG
ncbi:alpha/beta fold hydrolase [Promicromonospora thailandica]|uniref:alpha/beta hydrolase family protein n=1 Tax=Promicromonospora thailandica TaxID=765201 RepID=UPI0020A40187|nr:alpha/beta fold hydrolase [Promicromonospora thailandica]BFF19403.1 alpha/beta fold hydrolase [Promicromonospora thailandica]